VEGLSRSASCIHLPWPGGFFPFLVEIKDAFCNLLCRAELSSSCTSRRAKVKDIERSTSAVALEEPIPMVSKILSSFLQSMLVDLAYTFLHAYGAA
jgi:hypothetical protein